MGIRVTFDCQMSVGPCDVQGRCSFRPEMVPVVDGRRFIEIRVADGRRFAFGTPYFLSPMSVAMQQDVISPEFIDAGIGFRLVPEPEHAAGFVSVPVFGQVPRSTGTTAITGGNNMTSDKPLPESAAYADTQIATLTGFPVDDWAAGRVRAMKVGQKP